MIKETRGSLKIVHVFDAEQTTNVHDKESLGLPSVVGLTNSK